MVDFQDNFVTEQVHRSRKYSLAQWRLTGKLFAVVMGFLLAIFMLIILLEKFQVIVVMGLVLAVFLIVFLFYWPEPGTMLVIFTLYTNLAVIAYKFHDFSQILAASVSLVLCIPFAVYLFVRREKFIIDYPFMLMLMFLGALLLSLMVSKDTDLALEWIVTYLLEGVALYLIIINVVRKFSSLRRVIWTLLFAGSLLGGLTLFQELTHSYDVQFGGLAQRNLQYGWNSGRDSGSLIRQRDKIRLANRAGGPIGGPNRFAQIMLVLLPLGLFRFFDERSPFLKFSAIVATVLILCGILLTYSRGAFLTLVVLVMFMTLLRYIKIYQVLLSLVALILAVMIASPGYLARMDTIRGVTALFSKRASAQADAPTRGRVTEMLAALNVFLDYPIIGVGPGQYSKYYSMDYMNDPEIAFRNIDSTRRAHTLYFELMAETGLVGIATFMAIVLVILYRLWLTRRRWIKLRTELANVATAFVLSILSYLVSGVFLQLSYQRYYWLLLAVAGATIQILNNEFSEDDMIEATALNQ